MNYCILNGVKSNTVKGLLIQSLPVISKPLIRTEIEEIDGRDGDIVTPLGYSAYDKEMTIGLFGDYNIDDVISYFDSQGTVTFSNEPDKYYNYTIVEQIDFERLIRYKTADVKFHVQPFKYSAVDSRIVYGQPVDIPDYTSTKNGITLTADNGHITVSGTGTTATEFYVPIKPLTLEAGEYTLRAVANGTNAHVSSIRLIQSVPSNVDSFGGTYLGLKNNEAVTLDARLTGAMTFHYIWFYITAGTQMDYSLNVSVLAGDSGSFKVINRGNIVSRPKLTIYGNGTINISLNDTQIFVVDLGDMGYITIDSAQMNAYQGELFMNRYVTGSYEDLALKIGTNTISWTGNVAEMILEDCTRWI